MHEGVAIVRFPQKEHRANRDTRTLLHRRRMICHLCSVSFLMLWRKSAVALWWGRCINVAFLGVSLCAQEPTPPKTDSAVPAAGQDDSRKKSQEDTQRVKMPGIEINPVERVVSVDAEICLEEGALELIACTKDSKEHESIVVIHARPSHVHAALLLLGARNGHPAMRRALDEEMTRWEDIPPTGDPIDVSLSWKQEDGTRVERPLSDFLMRSEEEGAADGEHKEKKKFPNTFLFAGSHLGDEAETPRKYLAELSGNVISISTFGDELLCLPNMYGHENQALAWQIDPTHLPKKHTKVQLRLRVKKAQP
jgi:hypothetical protein